ncbi:hypothetical protein QBC40DRAFT_175644 [Triangularia verruculosa]|uniref:Uncharacterized protein n=1 Tax=Triangularia verruculosa TaxID=2587418 RepID=A0AAN7AW91_9PEZI|nr:hypothetical protein QBC40DRAFT_175644 [Triangularia verruculosa]
MARDNEASGVGQSKRPSAIHFDSSDQTQQQQQQTSQPQHRVKSQKHIVGGGASRLHARVPSSKGLYKHHGAAPTAKLNRRQGASFSPDKDERGFALASNRQHHRRATSELKLTGDSASNLKKNVSQTSLKRNRSQADVNKKSKSTTSLHRHTVSNPNVNKLKSSGASSKVHFNIGDDEQEEDSQDEGEWVDASTSASPLLSRRGSTISGNGQPPNPPPGIQDKPPVASPPSPTSHRDIPSKQAPANGLHSADSSYTRNATLGNSITSRILSRTSSNGVAPKMSTDIAVAPRPPAPRMASGPPTRPGSSQQVSPGEASLMQLAGGAGVRPGSSGKAELLTSRFVGGSSQEPGSGIPTDSFMLGAAANTGGASRAAFGGKAEASIPRRPRSMGNLSHAHHGEDVNGSRYDHQPDDDEADHQHPNGGGRSRRNGNGYVVPRDMNRTQQKLNLQRASSGLEPTGPAGMAMVPIGGGAPPLMGVAGGGMVANYGATNPKHSKILEKTGMQYLSVRRHQNPIARSIARIQQLPGMHRMQRIPPPSRAPSRRGNEPSGLSRMAMDHEFRLQQQQQGGGGTRPPSRAASGLRISSSAASSFGTDDDDQLGDGNKKPRLLHGGGGGLSGASLADGGNDAATRAQLEMMWNQSMDLSASQE